jgi:hypothetical protein
MIQFKVFEDVSDLSIPVFEFKSDFNLKNEKKERQLSVARCWGQTSVA